MPQVIGPPRKVAKRIQRTRSPFEWITRRVSGVKYEGCKKPATRKSHARTVYPGTFTGITVSLSFHVGRQLTGRESQRVRDLAVTSAVEAFKIGRARCSAETIFNDGRREHIEVLIPLGLREVDRAARQGVVWKALMTQRLHDLKATL